MLLMLQSEHGLVQNTCTGDWDLVCYQLNCVISKFQCFELFTPVLQDVTLFGDINRIFVMKIK